ncbi:NrsF family protein [Tropicimonas marinistellae]|uniref:NrsF family protein n=1 Tax=Tropicimonas marinistellae TaxID=1739787 RepID=UPI000833B876|nr:DUF1109 domain-containing protein [Tropicimonas marinistellae]
MKTEDLIATLAADPAPANGPSLEQRAVTGVAMGAAVSIAVFAAFYGPRPELGDALSDLVSLAKTLLPLFLGAMAGLLALRAARPGASFGMAQRLVWIVPAAVAALLVWAFATTPAAQRLPLFVGHSIHVCLPSILLLSLPILGGLIRALRQGAPVQPARCGALAGLGAAGLATALYSLFCVEDSPLFYGVWYSLGILLVTALGAYLGQRKLRW